MDPHSTDTGPDTDQSAGLFGPDVDGRVLASLAVGVYLIDDSGRVLQMNPAATALLGWHTAQLADLSGHDVWHAELDTAEQCPILIAARTGVAAARESDVFRRSDGSLLPVWWSATPLAAAPAPHGRASSGGPDVAPAASPISATDARVATRGAAVVAFGDATARQVERVADAADQERSRADLVSAQQIASDMGWSAEVAHLMSTADNESDALARLARLGVPRLGDVALVDVVDADGELQRSGGVAAPGVDLDIAAILARPGAAHVPGHGTRTAATVRRGRIVHLGGAQLGDPAVFSPPSLQVLADVGVADLLIVPLAARDHLVGVVGFIRRHGGAAFTATEEVLAADLGRRAGLVLDNIRINAQRTAELEQLNAALVRAGEHDRSVAAALQQAMLTDLPEPDHLHLVARYLPAAHTEQVGGDWYDAVVLPGGATSVTIGDVLGHDIQAAAVMGQLRSMLRAFAWAGDTTPSVVLGQLDRAMRDLRIGTLATVVQLVIEQTTADRDRGLRTLRWSNAGHPPPLLIHPDGHVDVLERDPPDVLLGVRPDTPRHDHTVTAPPGSSLLLYTDGLIETRDEDLSTGVAALSAAVTRHHRLMPQDLLDAVLADTVGPRPQDDVAVLLVRFNPEDRPRPAEAGPEHL